jgi:hypothetical protein
MNTRFFTLMLVASTLLVTGCKLEELNENPNSPLEVPLSTLLPPAQKNMANAAGGGVFEYTNIFSNHCLGTLAQPQQISNYAVDEVFVGYLWTDFYSGFMLNLRRIMDGADRSQSPHYKGVAQVMMAWSLGTLTALWGDVPFSQALDPNNQSPQFDSQQQIYATIQQLLTEAQTNLNAPQSAFSPGVDDLIYGGNLNQWVRAAKALQARYFLHLSKRNASAWTDALNALNGAMAGVADDMEYQFIGNQGDANPMYLFYQTTPYILVESPFRNLLVQRNDPRTATFLARRPFSADTIPGSWFSSIQSRVAFMTYVEARFIEAEALLQTGQGGVQQSLNEAVEASIRQTNPAATQAQIDAYLAAWCTLPGNPQGDLETIMEQKYIALFCQSEPYTDFRRTGLPALQPKPNGATAVNPNGEIPRRLIYPQTERLYNNQFPQPAPNMQDRFWWDQ